MSTLQVVATIAAAFLGGGGLTAVLVKWLGRDVDRATAEAQRAEARAQDINNLRSIITEVRQDKAEAVVRIESLEERMEKLEERERHMLTRAAVHEAWDQMAFSLLVALNPQHPPPPPLTPKKLPEADPDI